MSSAARAKTARLEASALGVAAMLDVARVSVGMAALRGLGLRRLRKRDDLDLRLGHQMHDLETVRLELLEHCRQRLHGLLVDVVEEDDAAVGLDEALEHV